MGVPFFFQKNQPPALIIIKTRMAKKNNQKDFFRREIEKTGGFGENDGETDEFKEFGGKGGAAGGIEAAGGFEDCAENGLENELCGSTILKLK